MSPVGEGEPTVGKLQPSALPAAADREPLGNTGDKGVPRPGRRLKGEVGGALVLNAASGQRRKRSWKPLGRKVS